MTAALRQLPVDDVRFGEFRLDLKRRRLIRGREAIPLPERLFGVLSLLLHADGAVVDKETFATIVWPDVIMTDSNLAQHIYQLRQLLGETARCRTYISSASGRGYRFTAPVYLEPGPPEPLAPQRDAPEANEDLEQLLYVCYANCLLENPSHRSVERAIQLFDVALELDPDYVPALLGFVRAHVILAESYAMLPAAIGRAKDAVARALEVNPHSGVGHSMRSTLLLMRDRNWAGARREIELAFEMDPHCSLVRRGAAWFKLYMANAESGIQCTTSPTGKSSSVAIPWITLDGATLPCADSG